MLLDKSTSYDDDDDDDNEDDEDDVDDDDDDNDEDDENKDVEISLEARLLSKIYHQMETFQNESLKYWRFQSKNSQKLTNTIQELTETLKVVIQRLPELNDIITNDLPSFQKLSNSDRRNNNVSIQTIDTSTPTTSLRKEKAHLNLSDVSDDMNDDSLSSQQTQSLNDSQNSTDEEVRSSKSDSNTKSDSNSLKTKNLDEYTRFKKNFEQLLKAEIPVKFDKYDFKELRTKKEAKKEGMNEILDEIEGKFIIIKLCDYISIKNHYL